MGDDANHTAFLEDTRRRLASTYNTEKLNGLLLSPREQWPPQHLFGNGNSSANLRGTTASFVASGWEHQLRYQHLPGDLWMAERPLVGSIAGGFHQGRIGGDLLISRHPPCPGGSEFSSADFLLHQGCFRQGTEPSRLSHPLVMDNVQGQLRSAPLASNVTALFLQQTVLLPSIEGGGRLCEASGRAGRILHSASSYVPEIPKNSSTSVVVALAEAVSRDATEDENEERRDHPDHSMNGSKRKRPPSDRDAEAEKHEDNGPRKHRHRKPSSQRRPYNCEPFSQKLFRMITDQEAVGRKDVVEFLDSGGGFRLHDPIGISELMPSYNFRGNKFSGFRRQLTSYGFRVEKKDGIDKGAYKNPLFLRGRPDLCCEIVRDDDKNDKSDMGTTFGRSAK